MGGDPIHHEPTVHDVLLQDSLYEHYFRRHSWIVYFLKIRDYNEEIASKFMHSFNEGEAIVKGLRVIATKQWIAEVTGLLGEELFPESKDARSAKAEFTLPIDGPLTVDKQGTRRVSLAAEWPQVDLYVMKYNSCEGRYSNLHSPHFKLLSHLRHGRRVNIPNFLYHLIYISAKET